MSFNFSEQNSQVWIDEFTGLESLEMIIFKNFFQLHRTSLSLDYRFFSVSSWQGFVFQCGKDGEVYLQYLCRATQESSENVDTFATII